jgi:outer membrane protein assembly factor BamB
MEKRNILFATVLIFVSSTIMAQKQYGWLGPDRSGIYKETGLLKAWPSSGPVLLWETTDIGTGDSIVTPTDDDVCSVKSEK